MVMATDPRNMTESMKHILFNKEVIEVFKDVSGFQSITMINTTTGTQVWLRPFL